MEGTLDEAKIKTAVGKNGTDRVVAELCKALPVFSTDDVKNIKRELLIDYVVELRIKNGDEGAIQGPVDAPEIQKKVSSEVDRLKKAKEIESKTVVTERKETPVKGAATKDPVVKTEITTTKEMTMAEMMKFFLEKEERDRKSEREREKKLD